jgi:hypothetical protein
MKTYGEVEIYLHAFLTSALHWGEWPASRPIHFTLVDKILDNHWLGGFVGPMAYLGAVVKRKICTPALNQKSSAALPVAQSLIWTSYTGSYNEKQRVK